MREKGKIVKRSLSD